MISVFLFNVLYKTKLFENIPVTITNKNELNERDLVIYPEQDLTTNIYVTGKLSNLKKVTKDDINVYGQINNPLEGNNEIYLKVSTSTGSKASSGSKGSGGSKSSKSSSTKTNKKIAKT